MTGTPNVDASIVVLDDETRWLGMTATFADFR